MQLKFLQHKEINKDLWDEKILQSENSRIYGLSGWQDITSPGWHALVSQNYEYIMPLPIKKKFGLKYLVQPKFTQQSGVFSEKKTSPEIVDLFLTALSGKYLFSNVNLNSSNKSSRKDVSEKPNHLLHLNSEYNILKKNFSDNTNRNIKKSEQFNIKLKKNVPINEAVLLKKENNINHLSDKDLSILQNLITFVKNTFELTIYGVYNEKKRLISVVVFSFYKNRISLPLIASSDEGKKKFASFQIFNAFIKDYSEKNRILDFEGSALPGVARFFESWGAKPETYYVFNHKKFKFPF